MEKDQKEPDNVYGTSTVIEEYDLVRKVLVHESQWEISLKNHIRLISIQNHNEIIANFDKLKKIITKYNISIARAESSIKSEQCQNSANFVKFFQTAEVLYDKLVVFHKFNFDIGDNVFTYRSLDTKEIDDLIANLKNMIQIINNKFLDVYANKLCLFTKEQFFILFQLLNRYFKDNEKSLDLLLIFEGTIISNFIARTKTPLDDYYNLIKKKFIPIEFDKDFKNIDAQRFSDSIISFSEILFCMIDELTTGWRKNNNLSEDLEINDNLDEYLTGKTVRCISTIKIKSKDKGNISSKYQLHSMILYLFKSYIPSPLPFPKQLLICSMSVTLSQINSFLELFQSSDRKKYMFIVVSPIQLQPKLYDYLMAKLIKINETTISQSRIVILFENGDLNKKPAFKEVIKSIDVDSFQPISNTEILKNLYTGKNKYRLYGIQTFYLYEKLPRTGKTHAILQHIYNNYPNHIYTRILVDECMTLTALIACLNEIRKINSKDKAIIIHFNVNGKCGSNFHLYIQNLAYFRSLNDGVSVPFVANNKMAFYFEFDSLPSFDKEDFIQNVFPIADYMEEIKIPVKTEEFFTYDEYHIVPHDEINGALKVIKQEKCKQFLIESATIAMLYQDKLSALPFNYSDYFESYKQLYDILENDPKKAYTCLLSMFKDFSTVFNNNIDEINNQDFYESPLISQINDACRIISKFKNLILSQSLCKTEETDGNNIRKFLIGLIIGVSVTNCCLPYIPPISEIDKVIDNPEISQERLRKIKQFITKGCMLAVSNQEGNAEEQKLTLICDGSNNFDELIKKFNFNNNEEIKNAIKSAMNAVDSEWLKNQILPDDLFRIFASIFNLQKYDEIKYNIAMLIYIWRSLDDKSRNSFQNEWNDNIEHIKANLIAGAKNRDEIMNETNLRVIYADNTGDKYFEMKRTFWNIFEDQIVKDHETCSDKNDTEKLIFDIGIEEDKTCEYKKILVSKDIYTFIANCEKYFQNENSLILKYTLTPHNLMIFIHLAYRIYSNIPIILMGETGSGKTFTLNFLGEIMSKDAKIIRYTCSNNTKEEDFRAFLRENIKEVANERSSIFEEKLKHEVENPIIQEFIRDLNKSIQIENEEKMTDLAFIKEKVKFYIDNIYFQDLIKYNISKKGEIKVFKKNAIIILQKICTAIKTKLKKCIFLFDEFNSVPFQWCIKEIILDRYFEGKMLPHYIHFVCTASPSRKLKYVPDILDQNYYNDPQNHIDKLAYKVQEIPESFIPYLFPVDPNRDKTSDEDYLFDIDINSEFDISIDKKVKSEFSLMTHPFIKEMNKSEEDMKIENMYHFSSTDIFSISFDHSFFFSKLNDTNKASLYELSLSHIVSRINIFCCRLSYHVIYNDESFSSIRDPERCIQIMRWAYKFGICEKLPDNLDIKDSIKRLRRAFIIGLSISFWIRLSDQKQKEGKRSHRKMFIKNVCKFWAKILDSIDNNEIKDYFIAPKPKEWIQIVEEECKGYANIFIDEYTCFSKNYALCENIWVSFICIMNNIPLWIVGKHGTSKSLAINIVINKLLKRNSSSEKIIKCPPIVSQIFACSSITKTEAIMHQLEELVDKSRMYDDNHIIPILILKNVEFAEMSHLDPLEFLHDIIDNGYRIHQGISVPIQFIGLSNCMINSSKLNRVVLLHRCITDIKSSEKAGYNMFKYLFNENLKFDDDNGKEKALERIYEKTKLYFSMAQLFQNNVDQDYQLFNNTKFNHIFISTVNAAAVPILVQKSIIQFTNYDKESPYEFFFPNNMTNLSDDEWRSNELKKLIEIMHNGDKTAIFIGIHPCFDCIYEIFKHYYQRNGGWAENIDNFYSIVAYDGNSYPIAVNNNFKAIIILESDAYNSLPQTFLDSFERFNLTYEIEAKQKVLSDSKENLLVIMKNFQRDNPSSVFGCYSNELLLSIHHIAEHNNELNVADLTFLSIHPADLIYSRKNDVSFTKLEIKSALKDNSNLRSSVAHLLKGYDDSYEGKNNISAYFYKSWQKNKGIKSVIMVPNLNIDKLKGYDLIKINSMNSFDVVSRIKAKIKTRLDESEKEKTQNPIVISILISQSSITIDCILQYEYILDKIKRWCQIELNATKPIHTLLLISMEHKFENLKINQSTEWPLIYLDTCYDDTIITNNKDGFPVSLEQIVFSPFKKLVDDEIIDLEELIKLSRKSIYPCYTESENRLIDKILFDSRDNYKTYILQFIKRLITELNEENNCTYLENLSENIDDLWTFKKITDLSSPPSSVIEYLSQKLVRAVGSIMSIIFELLLSGIDPAFIDEIDKKIFKCTSIFDYMMDRKEFNSTFHCILNRDVTLSCPIDYRYSYDRETFIPGQLAFYKFIWKIASNIYSNESISDDNDLYEKLIKLIFPNDDSILKDEFDRLMKSMPSSDDISVESSSSFTFIAAYLLVTASSVRVYYNYKHLFKFWISSFIEILKGFFYKKDKLTTQFIMYHLISNKTLSKFAHDFTIIFMFFPFPVCHHKKEFESFITLEREFYEKLIFDKVKDSIDDLPSTEHINTEAAYLVSRVILKNFINTINDLDIETVKAIELFKHEFITLSSIHNYLISCDDFINDFNFFNEPRYFPLLMTIQKFFIQYGDIIVNEKEKYPRVILKIKINRQSNYSETKVAQELIINLVKDQINTWHLERKIDPDNASSSLLMYYSDSIIDNNCEDSNLFEEEEEEEEESLANETDMHKFI